MKIYPIFKLILFLLLYYSCSQINDPLIQQGECEIVGFWEWKETQWFHIMTHELYGEIYTPDNTNRTWKLKFNSDSTYCDTLIDPKNLSHPIIIKSGKWNIYPDYYSDSWSDKIVFYYDHSGSRYGIKLFEKTFELMGPSASNSHYAVHIFEHKN